MVDGEKIVKREITVKGNKDTCGFCAKADEDLSKVKPTGYEYTYKYQHMTEKETEGKSIPEIDDCITKESGEKSCTKKIGYEPNEWTF